MRLNRGSLIFVAVLALVIIVALIIQMTPNGFGAPQTPTPVTQVISLFPLASPTSVTSLSITSQIPLGDTRPTPIPGNAPLPTLTPLPFGVDGPSETKSIVLQYDATTAIWNLGQGGTVTGTGPLMQQTVTTALTTLASLRSDQSIQLNGSSPAQYGLDTPNHEIVFTVMAIDPATGTATPTTHRLRLGYKSIDGTKYFAFLDEDTSTVYVVLGASALDSSVLRLVTQPPFTPAPTPTVAPVLTVPGTPFFAFNYNLASSFSVTDHANGHNVTLFKQVDGITWGIRETSPTQVAPTPEATAESTAEMTAEATSVADIFITPSVLPTQVGPAVDQMAVAGYLADFNSIYATSKTPGADLAALGLTSPRYTIEALMTDGTRYTLRIGASDPAGLFYYTLVNTFTDVVVVDANTVAPVLAILTNPPYLLEVTPETTAAIAPVEVTAEATAASIAPVEVTVEAETTAEATAEATQQ